MLTKAVRDALEAERETLKAQKRQAIESFDTQIKAIDALLNPGEHLGPRQLPLGGSPRVVAIGPLAGMGLREAMRTVMTAFPAGLRPAEIAQKLEQGGYRAGANSKLPTNTRVWAELMRLRKGERKVQKRGKRYVWIVPQHASGNNDDQELQQEREERLP